MRTATLVSLYAAAAAFGTYLTFRPTFDSGFERVQTERGDGLLNHYILENSWLALSDSSYRGTLLTAPFYHPTPRTIYYSENLFGVAPLYWALRLVLPYDLAYPWWQILLNLLNFIAFAWVARRLRWPHTIAIGGAFMWAFAMVHADQIKHQQMIGRFWMPVALYYAIELVNAPSVKALNRLLGSVFLQNLACIYTGWFLVAGLAVFVPVMLRLKPGAVGELKRFARENSRTAARVVVLWTLALLLLYLPYVAVNWGITRFYEESHGLLPTPSAWLTGPPDSKWSATTAPLRTPVELECWLFSGFTFYALMGAAFVGLFACKRDERPPAWPLIAAGLVTAAVWVLLTLAPHDKGESLWRVVRLAPGGMAIRAVSRVYLVVYLFGAFAACAWLAHVTERIRREWLRVAVRSLVVGFMIFEQTEYQQPSFERRNFYPLVDAAAGQLRGAEAGWVVPRYRDPTGETFDGVYGEVFAMWVGLRANVPIVNGYSGRLPNGYPGTGTLAEGEIRTWLKEQRRFRGPLRVVDTEGQRVADVVLE